MNHFLLVGLACYLVRIAFKGLGSQIRCAHIALGVAAGDQNGCGEQHDQRNLVHRSSSVRLTAIHHPRWLLALLLVQRPVGGRGTRPVRFGRTALRAHNAGLVDRYAVTSRNSPSVKL